VIVAAIRGEPAPEQALAQLKHWKNSVDAARITLSEGRTALELDVEFSDQGRLELLALPIEIGLRGRAEASATIRVPVSGLVVRPASRKRSIQNSATPPTPVAWRSLRSSLLREDDDAG